MEKTKLGFWRYLGRCLVSAKEDHTVLTDWIETLTPIGLFVGALISKYTHWHPLSFINHNVSTLTWVLLAFIAYRTFHHSYLRHEKVRGELNKVYEMPNLSGKWYRQAFGVEGILTIDQHGDKILKTSNFKEGTVHHEIDGEYKPLSRSFEISVLRDDKAIGPQALINQKVTWWLLDGKYLVFYTRNDGYGKEESGLFYRKAERPE